MSDVTISEMSQTKSLLSSAIGERKKRGYDGLAMSNKLGGILNCLNQPKVDKTSGADIAVGNKMFDDNLERVVTRKGSVNSGWLGMWKPPMQNPFNMYGTLPSKTRCRDKRKAFSVPPLEDPSDSLRRTTSEISGIIEASKLTKMYGDPTVPPIDVHERRMHMPPSIEMQRISTILSDPKSSRSSYTSSTARSTIDSFRFSDPFDECVIANERAQSCKSLERLLNNLYKITQNGFLSGSLPENPWTNKDHVDAEFIAATLARRRQDNPCLRLMNDLEAIVTLPTRHRRSKDPATLSTMRTARHCNDIMLTCMDTVRGPTGGLDCQRSVRGRLSIPRPLSSNIRQPDFQLTCEEHWLIWNASTETAKATIRRSGIVKRPVVYELNDTFMLTDVNDYASIMTRFGRITYSPKFKDEEYMYRFIIIPKEAQEAVETLSRTSPRQGRLTHTQLSSIPGKRYLTECEVVSQLGIQMSPGWEHFMYFKNGQKELVLRKRL